MSELNIYIRFLIVILPCSVIGYFLYNFIIKMLIKLLNQNKEDE